MNELMVKKNHLEQKVYDYIVEKINSREILPQQHIKELDISRELEISRTPIRSAFKRLEEDGIIDIIPYKGAQILKPKIDQQAFQERVNFLELLTTYYLQRLEIAEVDYQVDQLKDIYNDLVDLQYHDDLSFEKLEVNLWKEILIYSENAYIKAALLQAFREIFLESKPLFGILRSSRKNKLKHYNQLISYLDDNNYTHARRELRILFNQLNLNVIQGV